MSGPDLYLSKDFKSSEFDCGCGCGLNNISMIVVQSTQNLRNLCKFPLILNSACRCEKHNKEVGGEKDSYHLTGKALDIRYADPEQYYKLVKFMPLFFNGIGFGDGFIHGDIRPIPAAFNYYHKYTKK